MFELDPKLEEDTVFVHQLALCDVRLMRDANYPWLILIPRREGVAEIYQLSSDDQYQLLRESGCISKLLSIHFAAHKMNIAALGNQVKQLHIHHVVRFEGDPSWPKPIWGQVPAKSYSHDELDATITSLQALIVAHKQELNGQIED